MDTFSFIVGNSIPKSVKCIHSATKPKPPVSKGLGGPGFRVEAAGGAAAAAGGALDPDSFERAPLRALGVPNKGPGIFRGFL